MLTQLLIHLTKVQQNYLCLILSQLNTNFIEEQISYSEGSQPKNEALAYKSRKMSPVRL